MYKVDSEVCVYSRSNETWYGDGKVTEMFSDGSARVAYKDGSLAKTIPENLLKVRLCPAAPVSQAEFNEASDNYRKAGIALLAQRRTTLTKCRSVDVELKSQGKDRDNEKGGTFLLGAISTIAVVAGGPVTATIAGVGAAVNGFRTSSLETDNQKKGANAVQEVLKDDKMCTEKFIQACTAFRQVCARVHSLGGDEDLLRMTQGFLGRALVSTIGHTGCGLVLSGISAYSVVSATQFFGQAVKSSANGANAMELFVTGGSQCIDDVVAFGGNLLAGADDIAAGASAGSKAAGGASVAFVGLSVACTLYYAYDFFSYNPTSTSAFHAEVKKYITETDKFVKEFEKTMGSK